MNGETNIQDINLRHQGMEQKKELLQNYFVPK